MINPLNKTEYSFRLAYGKIKEIVARAGKSAVIADRYTTFGHIPFYKLCKKEGKKPILGVELAFVDDALLRNKQNPWLVTLLAINPAGLKKIYQLTTKSTKQKYYYNRLSKEELRTIPEDDVVIIYKQKGAQEYLLKRKNTYYALTPESPYNEIISVKHPLVACSDNKYDVAESEELYQIIMGNGQWDSRPTPLHTMEEYEFRYELENIHEDLVNEAIKNTYVIEDSITSFEFPKANLPKHTETRSLLELCEMGAVQRGCDLENKTYRERLTRELDLIKQKGYEDYFYLVWDLVKWSKEQMLVGPARGSSAGSLVCYLLFITDIDPIPFNLIFERFIDINRMDMPDVDIDFQDTEREKILGYLKEKYGHDCVAKLGTVSKYKPKSILTEIAKVFGIPAWEMNDLKSAIPERSGGDARANNCIEDTFTDLQIGKEFLEKHPQVIFAQDIEGHNRHFGQHAAGIVVSDSPITNYCAIDAPSDGCMLDKKDAEEVNLLKMDCLGLRTLSVIQCCLDLINKDRDWIVNYPLDDKKAYAIINERKFSGIFQFEGYALINVAKQILIQEFEDIAAITALARPGPLVSGGTNKYITNKNNSTEIKYMKGCKDLTLDTHGVVVYQEQVMNIVRNVGQFSWEDTSFIRKAMSKTLGDEFFSKYKNRFIEGAKKSNNIPKEEAEIIWGGICTMGSWAFNKSHAVSYGLISYWCMVLKAHWPLEFALATLKNAKDEEQTVNILKELDKENIEFQPFNPKLSEIDWSANDGKIIGGFKNIKGVGPKKAQTLTKKRREGTALTVAEKRLIYNAETPYDCVFEFRERFSDFYENWELFFKEKPVLIEDIEEGQECRFLCKTIDHSTRDMNEDILIKKRDGKVIEDGCTAFLDLKMSDDTDMVQGRINRELFEKFGRDIAERDKLGSYYLVSGFCCKDFKYIIVKVIKKITPEEAKEKIRRVK